MKLERLTRRVAAAIALTLAVSVPLSPALSKEKQMETTNPLATEDQTELMARALRLIETPEVKQARKAAEIWWKGALHDDPPAEAWASFDSMMDDFVYNYALKAANSDPNYPKVLHVYTPPRMWKGMEIPGSRWGGDNPDNIYRIIPIDENSHYRLDVQRIGKGVSDVTYTLVGNWETSVTLNGIHERDIPVGAGGKFSITIGPEPANGRPNHIQTKEGSLLLFIRDSLGDWDETPNALTIHRLDPPTAPPITDQKAAERAADIVVRGVPQVYFWIKFTHGAPNEFPLFFKASDLGGLTSQRNSTTQAQIEDDEALIITLYPADAAYFSMVAQNYWFITIDYANRHSTLNNGQVKYNPDGTITFVAAIEDPGVPNWIDIGGLNNPILQIRLQGLPEKLPGEPWVVSQLVKLPYLKFALPKDIGHVTPEERKAQIATRQKQVAKRLADH